MDPVPVAGYQPEDDRTVSGSRLEDDRTVAGPQPEDDRSVLHQTDHVFAGNLHDLPEKESSVVRIFLSSTFTDMQSERNWLMKNAVPHLRRFCQERGLDFQIADMRWGVRDDALDDHRTAELCVREIRNCQKVSRGPNFVAFLGDKYGYRPLPPKIESSQFKLLKKTAIKLGYDTTLLLTWYVCDNNEEPAMYVLLPVSSKFPSFLDLSQSNTNLRKQAQKEWASVSERLAWLLRDCADHLYRAGKLSKEERHIYFRSVTDEEVESGMLATRDVQDKVACFQRTLIELDKTDSVAWRYTDLVDDGIDAEAEELREHLRLVQLPSALPPDQLFRYNVPWKSEGINITGHPDHHRYVEQFGQDFTKTIEMQITEAVNKARSVKGRSPLFEEVLHHLHFCKTKCDTFCGRDKLLKDIHAKLINFHDSTETGKESEDGKTDGPVDVSEVSNQEEAGSDTDDDSEIRKVRDISDKEREKRQGVLAEFEQMAGTLERLGVVFTMGDSMDDMESDPKFNLRDRLTEMPKIKEYTKPVIIFGESGCGKTALMAKVTQLSHKWFPNSYCMVRFLGTSTMSSTIREVLSSLCHQIWHLYKVPRPAGMDLEADFQFLIKYFAALLWQIDTKDKPLVIVLDSVDQLIATDHAHFFNWFPHKLPPTVHLLISMVSNRHDCLHNIKQIFVEKGQYIEIDKMEYDTAASMITALCIKGNRHLSKKQRNLLMDKFESCGQPLFLKLLTDMAMSWRSFTKVNKAALGTTVKEAINHLFNNLEKKHGDVLIKKAFAYLCAAREGLTDAEIEDLLSLDDEVLQDTYIYHLPPDPDVIRLPPLLWKRVQYDIEEYVVERQSGVGKKVITWYHRQFSEAATDRYLTEEIKPAIHKAMAEYFQGIWSIMFKPLELKKGKKGYFPKAVRNVPPQPLKFSDTLYNTRKLSELPYHLILSQKFQTLLTELLIDPEWLYAKCHTMSLTALMEDLQMAESLCTEQVAKVKQELSRLQGASSHRRKIDDCAHRLQTDTEVLASIKLLAKAILLASDSVRKDPIYLPLQILCQFGPGYSGSSVMGQSVELCRQWCERAAASLLLPQTQCMMKPGGHLLYTIEVDMILTGDRDRDKHQFQSLYLREDIGHLFVVNRQSSKPDQIAVFDVRDYGSCILTENFSCYIHSIQFAGNNKYLLLETSDGSVGWNRWKLYRSSTASPVALPHPPITITVSHSGKHIAYSAGSLVEVYSVEEGNLKPYYTMQDHKNLVNTLIISPDDSLLVSVEDYDPSSPNLKQETILAISDLKQKKLLHKNTLNLDVNPFSKITRQNYLVCRKSDYNARGTLIVYDLKKAQIVREIFLSQYQLDHIQLHSSQMYVLIGSSSSSVVNGDRDKHSAMVSIKTSRVFGHCETNGPYSAMAVFGTDSLYYAVCNWSAAQVIVYFAGYTTKPLERAVAVHRFSGHSMSVLQILVTSDMGVMYTASRDNTIKVWELKPVLEEFTSELKRVEKRMTRDADLEDMVAQLKLPEEVIQHTTTRVALNRHADSVYVGTDTSQLRMYDVKTGDLKLTSDLDIGMVTHMMLSKNGQFLIVGGKTIHIEDLLSVNSRKLSPRGRLGCMAESNNILVAGSPGMEAKARVWNIETGEALKDFELLYTFSCVAINSLGNMVLASFFDFPIIVHLTDDQESSMDMDQMDTMMTSAVCCCFSPNDKLAACGSTDGAVRVISTTGTYMYRLQQRSSAVALAFKPDGKSLVSAGYRSIYVWNLRDGSLRYKLTRHRDFVNTLMFDETGRYLVTASRDKQLVLWDFRHAVSIATCQTYCQVSSIDVGPYAEVIAYVPEGIADVAIMKPNQSLTSVIRGRYKAPALTPQTQALALAFSGQTTGKTSRACNVM